MIDRIYKDLTAALKAGDKKTASALRLLYSSLKNALIDNRDTFNDDMAVSVIKKEMKKRVEARDLYAANGREEQAAQEEFERTLYSQYAPADLTQDQIDALIVTAVKDGIEPVFAKLMPYIMKEAKGSADGKLVSDRVKNYIQQESVSE